MAEVAEGSRSVKSVGLDILLAIKRVCEANDLAFFLDSGTLLGAARHRGFIPWDDDVDIWMPRFDYDRFLEIGQSELGDSYFLQTRETDPESPYSYAKVRKNGTVMMEKCLIGRNAHNGVWVDIFPFDTIRPGETVFKKKKRQQGWRYKFLLLRTITQAGDGSSLLKRVARSIVRLPLCVVPEDVFYRTVDSLADDIDPKEGSYVCFHYCYGFMDMPYDRVFPNAYLEFEGHMFPVVKDWEYYLTTMYGDWRTPPPIEERGQHDILEIDLGQN